MRILFYLPVVTPWWFREVITPMLRALHRGGGAVELHVMVAPLWRNTGLQPDDLLPAADLDEAVHWHIIDQGEPEQFRLSGAEVPGLLDQVNRIDPDITLARSADFAISRQFPGVVRYIMEGAAPPFGTDPEHVVLDERPFAPAEVPAHAATLADAIAERLRPSRDLVQRRPSAGAPAMLRERLGLPSNRRVVAIPLQYAHEENFFLHHAGFPDGLALIGRLLAKLDESVVLAFVDHPLNRRHSRPECVLHVDRHTIGAHFAADAERIVDCTGPHGAEALAMCADIMVADLSKSWMLAAFHGTPLVNVAHGPTASWLNAVPGLSALSPALASGTLSGPDASAADRWFAWHIGARLVEPRSLTPDRLLRCIEQRPSEADVADNLAKVEAHQRRLLSPRTAAA
jgi:hypothetical protein